MAKETDLQYAARQLNERKGLWRKISGETDTSYSTVRSIARGTNTNPTLGTVAKLVAYFKGKNK